MGETTFEREVLDRLTRIETKTDGLDELKKVVYQNRDDIRENINEIENLKKQMEDTKEKNKWWFRTIASAIVVSIVGLIFCFIKIGMGV